MTDEIVKKALEKQPCRVIWGGGRRILFPAVTPAIVGRRVSAATGHFQKSSQSGAAEV
jgi:hypothetical protein